MLADSHLRALPRAARGLLKVELMKSIPTVQKYMSTSPHTIGADQSIAQATAVMKEFHIRHLPVLRGGSLQGVISERDIAILERLKSVNPRDVTVDDAMPAGVYFVAPDAPLDEVAQEMAAKKYGSAVVVDHSKVVGILTTVDICQALADLLQTRLKK